MFGVQVRKWLVEKQDLRLLRQRQRQQHTLTFARRELPKRRPASASTPTSEATFHNRFVIDGLVTVRESDRARPALRR